MVISQQNACQFFQDGKKYVYSGRIGIKKKGTEEQTSLSWQTGRGGSEIIPFKRKGRTAKRVAHEPDVTAKALGVGPCTA